MNLPDLGQSATAQRHGVGDHGYLVAAGSCGFAKTVSGDLGAAEDGGVKLGL
jgi:hypothetical protein